MRAPIEWLHEYCRPDLDTAALANRLAMTGTEVERIEHHGVRALEQFVVGRVLEATQHPDADRLSVCLVDIGNGEPSQIVCGAPNVAAGQTVAVAKPGAIMPDGTKLTVRKLRGQESNGMILAEDEVGIGTEHAGIMVLGSGSPEPGGSLAGSGSPEPGGSLAGSGSPEPGGSLAGSGSPETGRSLAGSGSLEPGTPLTEVLPLETDVLDLEITSNRPDCLGIYGVAREVHAATGAPLAAPPWVRDPGSPGELDVVKITVESPDLCPRFTARAFEEVKIGPSPRWLKARLMAAGQRPISNVVDITNYVMLLTGQPVHAFDLDRIAGRELTVRTANAGETVKTLDGQTRTLSDQMVLIADAEGPTSIAGVMGGSRSEVEAGTTRVLMEMANWNGANIHRTSLALGLRSEASTRFEKQLQPEQAMEAQAVAAQLMVELCGARLRPGTIDIGGPGPPPRTIRLRDARVSGLLGIEMPRERSAEILQALEFTTAEADDGLDVTVPAFRRGDVTREADVIEEVARLGAMESLPATLPSRHGAWGRLTPRQRLRRRASDALVGQGLHEVVGWSFVAPEAAERLRIAGRPAVELENPMSSEQARLRTTLLGSLLDVAQRNGARGAGALRLFEAGAVYLPGDTELPCEPYHVAALLTGAVRPPTWREATPPTTDFFAAEGVLAGLLEAVRVTWSVEPTAQPEPFLHPGKAARILVDGEPCGWIGEIHPQVAAGWERSDPIAAFELDLDAVAQRVHATRYRDVTSFPEVREDLAVVVADTVSAAEVTAVVGRAGGALLQSVAVFDVYRDPTRIGPGNVSLALRLSFRAADRTLTDEEVAAQRQKISAALSEQLDGRVRDS